MEHDALVLAVLTLTSSALLYLAYRAALPKPIPGIAYNKSAANSLFGDIPNMIRYISSTSEIYTWFSGQCVRMNSPIVQLFIRPFGRPMVFITDWRESQDILMRRKEFDRSHVFGEVLGGLLPNAFLAMPTNDTFRHQRRLLANTMSPAFLHQVAAPRIYNAALELIELWHLKINLAGRHPFSAPPDIDHVTLDAIWASTFGTSSGATKSQVHLLSSLVKLEALPRDQNVPADFPKGPTPPAFNAVVTLSDSIEKTASSPLPSWRHWLIRQTPSYRTAKKIKDDLLDEHWRNARTQYSDDPDDQKDVRSAVENVLQREAIAAKKEGRTPQFDDPVPKDELWGFLFAGHETTATTICWSLKLLADHPQVQKKLRNTLRNEYPEEAAAGTNPSAKDIVDREIPYLDAVIEEILRYGRTSNGAIRTTTVDADVLGCRIPAGTEVFLLSCGPSFMSPGFDIEESRRSPSSQANREKRGDEWATASLGAFDPERWLTRDEKGGEVYDPRAGPQLAFGLGPRGCFGKKLAYLNLRILILLIVWNFELEKTPSELSGYGVVDKMTGQPQQCFVRLGLVRG